MSSTPFDSWSDWLADKVPSERRADFLVDVTSSVLRHTETWLDELTQREASSSEATDPRYLRRVERCLRHHWERFAEQAEQLPSVEDVLVRLERGDLGYDRPQTNVVREVIMAQALEQYEPRAAERFEYEFMPTVRRVAQRTAGQCGLDLVENFAADLVLPRETRPPRIAGYLGKTSLASWLRVVVTNHCRAAGRKIEPVQSFDELDSACPIVGDASSESNGCDGILQPIFTQAVNALESEDRLLIKLLIVEEVPQHTLAQQMGIHSGNVTRRRQRISETVWARVQELRSSSATPGRVADCLELVLTGNQTELKRSLGDVLSRALTVTEDTR